jgi:flavin-dependent dehydrogenase
VEATYERMIARCRGVAENLEGAERITPVHSAANFSYRTEPVAGDRFLCVGDSVVFIDPIFSTGVFVAMQSAELASVEILRAFRDDRFRARRFGGYLRQVRRGLRPFTSFINRYYEPAFLEVLLRPKKNFGILDSVTGLLAGGAFIRMPLRMRLSLVVFSLAVGINTWRRRWIGLPTESRLTW